MSSRLGSLNGGVGFFLGGEDTQASTLAINSNTSKPAPSPSSMFGSGLHEIHSRIPRACMTSFDPVLGILSLGEQAKVVHATVKPDSVTVVNDQGITVIHASDFSVQQQGTVVLASVGVASRIQAPEVLQHPISFLGVNQGVRLDRTVTRIQGDEGDILVAHQGNLLVSCPWSAPTLAGVFPSVAEGSD